MARIPVEQSTIGCIRVLIEGDGPRMNCPRGLGPTLSGYTMSRPTVYGPIVCGTTISGGPSVTRHTINSLTVNGCTLYSEWTLREGSLSNLP